MCHHFVRVCVIIYLCVCVIVYLCVCVCASVPIAADSGLPRGRGKVAEQHQPVCVLKLRQQ